MLKVVNPKTGQVMLEEHDDGTINLVAENLRTGLGEDAADDGYVPSAEELAKLVAQIEQEDLAEEKVVPYAGGPVIDSDSWDASAAKKRIAKWASTDGSGDKEKIRWDRYEKGFLFVDGPRDNFGSYSYPHHDIKDNKLHVHKKGVISAMAFLLKVRPPETAGGHRHLAGHYKALGMEVPPLKKEAYTDEEMATYFGEDWRSLIAAAL